MSLETTAPLESLLRSVPEDFRALTAEEATQPRAPGKWSRLQILGHLCDSAVNNLARFVKGASLAPDPLPIEPYDQEAWVAVQRYGEAASVEEVLTLWSALNVSVVRVVQGLSGDQLARPCRLPDGTIVTLGWLFEDYVDHLKHHLRQIFGDR